MTFSTHIDRYSDDVEPEPDLVIRRERQETYGDMLRKLGLQDGVKEAPEKTKTDCGC